MAIGNTLLNISVGVLGGEQAIKVIGDLGNVAVDTAIKTDRMNSMMTAASGSTKAAAANMEFISRIAKQMGTDIVASANSYSQLVASTRGTVLEGERTQKMFEALSAANTKMGGSVSDLSGMINAFSQMISKGTVSMEELRGQLGERLPGAMKLAADSMGITTQALIDQVSSGNVLAEDLLPRLANAINNTYNDGKFDTAAANINRLNNSWFELKQNIVNSDWINSVVKDINQLTSVLARNTSTTIENQIAHAQARIETYKSGGGLSQFMADMTGYDINIEYNRIDNLKKQLEEKRKKEYTQPTDTGAQSAYVTQTKEFLEKHETDKLKIIENARKKELDENQAAWTRAIKTQENNGKRQLEITEAFKQRELAINKQYDDKMETEQKRLDAPGKRAAARAERKEERDAAKAQREYESMVERSRDLIASLENDYLNYTSKTFADSIKKIDALAEAQKKAELDKVINAKLSGEQLAAANEQLAKVNAAIDAKAAADKEKVAKDAIDKIKDYENDLTMDIAKLNNDRLTQVRLVYEAQTKANKKELDKQVQDAKNSQQQIANAERLYEQRQTLLDKKYSDDRVRISGSYLDKLSLKMRETYSNESSIVDEFNTGMVETTMNAANGIADSFAQMAVSGKASWADLANSVILEIEKMIAKMMVMYAVQQLVGMAGSMIGGETGGLINKSVGLDPFNGSGPWMSFANANGNAFDSGNVIPFANGGIVDKPVLFPMARGTGLMGEAGPEAIMPLTRDGSGRLGVKAHGGSSGGGISIGSINVQVPASKDPEKQGQIIGSAIERQIKQLIQLQIKDSFRPGNTMNPSKTVGGGVLQS